MKTKSQGYQLLRQKQTTSSYENNIASFKKLLVFWITQFSGSRYGSVCSNAWIEIEVARGENKKWSAGLCPAFQGEINENVKIIA